MQEEPRDDVGTIAPKTLGPHRPPRPPPARPSSGSPPLLPPASALELDLEKERFQTQREGGACLTTPRRGLLGLALRVDGFRKNDLEVG